MLWALWYRKERRPQQRLFKSKATQESMAFGRTSHCPNPTPFAELRRTLGARLMWFLIASEQITQAKNRVNQSMTMEQLLEAEQRAAEWMRKGQKDSAFVDRKSFQGIHRLIGRRGCVETCTPNRTGGYTL
jgi:hypothetical protein